MAGVCLIKIRGDGVKVVRGGILGGLQRPGRDGGAERLLQSLLTPGPASECPLGGGDPWEAQPHILTRNPLPSVYSQSPFFAVATVF